MDELILKKILSEHEFKLYLEAVTGHTTDAIKGTAAYDYIHEKADLHKVEEDPRYLGAHREPDGALLLFTDGSSSLIKTHHHIEFKPSGRGKARIPPNPDYPNGRRLDVTEGQEASCYVNLPYPAPECGIWIVECGKCRTNAAVTAAGRPDDPISIKIPCKKDSHSQGTYRRADGVLGERLVFKAGFDVPDDDHAALVPKAVAYDKKGKGMIIDRLIYDYRYDAVLTIKLMQTMDDKASQQEAAVKAHMQHKYADSLESSVRYWLDVREIEKFRTVKIRWKHFPPCIHDQMFIEFNGELKFDFRPWKRPDIFVSETEQNLKPAPLVLAPYSLPDTTYRAVHIQRNLPPHKFFGWPEDKPVIRATWYEKPMWIKHPELGDIPAIDNYVVTLCESVWPKRLDVFKVGDPDEIAHPGERAHADRLMFMTANLMYFLAAENIVKVRIRPEHHERCGRELSGLPKSDKPYYVLPFQLPRYRYLHRDDEKPNGTTGRHVSVCFDVRGHFRHLDAQRFERDANGNVRVIWIGGHQRGLGHVYRPTVRRGLISHLFLDYDKFIAQETKRAR
jgi:hypothetical protein